MAMTVKEITLWRREIDNQPGVLAQVLDPLADSRVDLTVLMAYRFTGNEARGAVELYPVAGKKATVAARAAGLTPADIPALLVAGVDRPGIGYATTRAIADAGINLAFLVAQVVGAKFSAVYGFDNESDRRRAVNLLRKTERKR
jgi:predicted amino acid-binding ACT domain protein